MTALIPFVIALDGPAASGKSTVGLGVARLLGFFYFDTGVLYRAITWVVLSRGIDPADAAACTTLAEQVCLTVRPPLDPVNPDPIVLADEVDITPYLRRPEVDANVSAVSAHAGVRAALHAPQRGAIHAPGTILAGRDIGTVIVPDAPLKIWLEASAEERARRRATQRGEPYAQVLAAMLARDRFDGSRAVAPMAKAPDAVEVHTDGLTPDQVIARIAALARERGAKAAASGTPTPE